MIRYRFLVCILGILTIALVFNICDIKGEKSTNNIAETNTSPKTIETNKDIYFSTQTLGSNQELLNDINAIEKFDLAQPPKKSDYKRCQQITKSIKNIDLSDDLAHKLLLKCRIIRNKYGVTDEKLTKWMQIKDTLTTQGWQFILETVRSGEIPIDISLQDGEPKHNLHALFVANKVTDIAAYESLLEMGLELNSKVLFLALTRQNENVINIYKNSPQFYEADDMLSNSITQAASAGSLKYMSEFLDFGLPYYDSGNREPLTVYLSKSAFRTSPKDLAHFIRKHNIPINNKHLAAAHNGNAHEEIIKILKQFQQE